VLPEGIARYLDTVANLVTYDATGTTGDVFLERMPQTPSTAVAIYQYGGTEADALHGYDSPSLQVKVRGTADPTVSRALAQDIYDALHGLSDVTLPDGTALEDCIGTQSGPVSIGVDGNGRHEHVVNFRTEIRNTANRS
jgi:hypothetical protein